MAFVKKLIYNYKSFGDKLLLQVEGFDIGTDYDDVQRAYEFMLYERSYFYLSCLDISNPNDLKVLKEKSDKTLLFSLNTCLLYFEEQEEYEKCSFIKEILDLSKDFCEKTWFPKIFFVTSEYHIETTIKKTKVFKVIKY